MHQRSSIYIKWCVFFVLCVYCATFSRDFGLTMPDIPDIRVMLMEPCLSLWCDPCNFCHRSWWSTSVSWSRRREQWPLPGGTRLQLPLQVNWAAHQSTVCPADVNNKSVICYQRGGALNITRRGFCCVWWERFCERERDLLLFTN